MRHTSPLAACPATRERAPACPATAADQPTRPTYAVASPNSPIDQSAALDMLKAGRADPAEQGDRLRSLAVRGSLRGSCRRDAQEETGRHEDTLFPTCPQLRPHAFPSEKMKGRIIITYEVDGTNWKLSVADNGVGKPDGVFAQPETGLGTGIVQALAQQLGARVETLAGSDGTIVSITHATFASTGIRAA
jgi:hypothetical protein